MKKIAWGIIGLGNIANKFADALIEMNEVELKGVASRNKDKSEIFGKKYGLITDKCYGSYDELVKDKDIEAIYIAVPHILHKDISILCLKNGKSVLCEKPVAMNENEIKEVINIATEHKTFFMEAMKTRFLPVNQKVKQWINEGRIGDVRLLQADFGFKAQFDPENRLFNKELGGGSLLDVGIYNVSYSSYIFGTSPTSIDSNKFIGKSGVDESASVILSYEDGKQALLYSAINLDTIRTANIIGTKGRIGIPRFSNADTAYIIINDTEEKIHIPIDINGMEYQVREVVKCINKGEIQSDIMSWNDSIETMKIMDRIRS
nr:Gfo/Idh/MocA family oxidoreductase [uncultured Clostridium sp.]